MDTKILLMRRSLLISIFLSSCALNLEDEIPLSLTADSSSFVILELNRAKQEGYIITKDKKKYLVYGLPYVTKEQSLNLGEYNITIKPKFFGESRIEISDTNLVTPKLSDQERASAEYLKVKKIVKGQSQQFVNDFDFISPIESVITSPFGKRRFINGNPRSPHMALDLRGSVGTEIFAPMAGKVVMAEVHFYGGNKIILDHGGGLFTAYSHLSKFNVEEGEFVEQGAIIGYVGMTGRVTGPHLHWEVYLNEERINPELLVDLEYAQD